MNMGKLLNQSNQELIDQAKKLADAEEALKKSQEEKRLAAIEAAKKAKAKGKKGKGKAEDEPTVEESDVLKTPLAKVEENYDLSSKEGFEKALKAKIGRPFVFGPVEFSNLHLDDKEQPYDYEKARSQVV